MTKKINSLLAEYLEVLFFNPNELLSEEEHDYIEDELVWVKLDGEPNRRLAGFVSLTRGGTYTVRVKDKYHKVDNVRIIRPIQKYDDNPAPFGIYAQDYDPDKYKNQLEIERNWQKERLYRGWVIEIDNMSDGGAPGTTMYQATATREGQPIGDNTIMLYADYYSRDCSKDEQIKGIKAAIDEYIDTGTYKAPNM